MIYEILQKKRNKVFFIFVICVAFLSISLFIMYSYFENSNKNNDSNKTKAFDFNGVYKNDKCDVTIYHENDNNIIIHIKSDINENIYGYIDNNILKGRFLGRNIDFINVDGNLSIQSDFDYKCNGLYNKIGKITKEEFYEQAFNDEQKFYSKYNGVYQKGDAYLYMYQKNDEEVSTCVVNNKDYLCVLLNIEDQSKLYEKNVNKYTIIINDENSIEIIDSINTKKNYSGVYTKISQFTIKELEKFNYPMY